MRVRFKYCLFLIFSDVMAVAAGKSNLTFIKGRIVAFRPAEQILQTVSFVVNQETLLLRIAGKKGQIVKIVYEHDGYSEMLESNDGMTLKVRRDRTCDGDYGQYVMKAPILTSDDKEIVIPRITMIGGFNGLPSSYKLKCYRLERENIRMDETNR
jgi:hypothetical protein